MLNFKTKEYTFKDDNGNDINIKYNYTEKTRELLKMMPMVDNKHFILCFKSYYPAESYRIFKI